jgi:hypothetical protein
MIKIIPRRNTVHTIHYSVINNTNMAAMITNNKFWEELITFLDTIRTA